MLTVLDYTALATVFRAAAAKVKAGAERLGQLDSAIGDGDHGIAMGRAMDALVKGIDTCPDPTPKALLKSVGRSVMGIDAGSTGPLMGSLLMGMGEPIGDATEIDAGLLARMLGSGVNKLRAISKAQVGDKTMVDALAPAAEALRAAAEAGDSLAAALAKAAAAAEAGAERTKDYQARFGKARNLGPRSIGHEDPGATSIALFLRGCADGAAAGA